MNNVEFEKLQDSALSHQARSLYLFYLRPLAEKGIYQAPLSEISHVMFNNSPVCPFAATPEICQALMNELFAVGLLAPPNEREARLGAQYRLPYFETQNFTLPEMPFMMHDAWRPGPAFAQSALLSGLESADFAENELKSFIAYWSCKPERRNQIAWERTFAQRLKRSREARVRRSSAQQASGLRQSAEQVSAFGQSAEVASGIAQGYTPK